MGGRLRFAMIIGGKIGAGEAVRHPAFSWTAQTAQDWRERSADWPQTRYMSKGVREGALKQFDFIRN